MSISYDGIAAHYDRTRQIPREAAEDIRDAALRLLDIRAPAKVYEPGVGTGLMLAPFHDADHACIGCDISPAMLAQAKLRLPRAILELGDAVRAPAAARGAALALTSGLLHVTPQWREVIDATWDSLADGGVLATVFARQETPAKEVAFDELGESYERALADAGYRPEAPSAREPEIRSYLIELARRAGATDPQASQAILTRRWVRELSLDTLISMLRDRVYSWQQQVPVAEHDALIARVVATSTPPRELWPQIVEKRIYRLSVHFLRRPPAQP